MPEGQGSGDVDREEKTEPPTWRRRQKARRQGQVVKSQDVNTALMFFTVYMLMLYVSRYYAQAFLSHLRELFSLVGIYRLSAENLYPYLFRILLPKTLVLVVPVYLFFLLMGLAVHMLQVGFFATTEKLKPDFDKINIFKGLKNLLSGQSVYTLLAGIIKIGGVGMIAFFFFRRNMDGFSRLAFSQPETAVLFLTENMKGLMPPVLLLLGGIAAVDYLYQWSKHEKSLMMTKKEVKDEHKEMEGDPLIKSKRRQFQRNIMRQKMMQDVKTADAVITNPQIIAVALKYDAVKMDAPCVVAKGMNKLAEEIVRVSQANGVVIIQDRKLARILYRLVEVGATVPEKLYKAVAEVLAYVYKVTGKNE